MAPRGRGGKFSKPSRGGGKHFSRDVQPVDKDGNRVGLWREPDEDSETSSEGEEGSDSEQSSSDEGPQDEKDHQAGPSSAEAPELTREERRAAAKAKKQAAIARRQKVEPGDLPPSDSESDDDNNGDEDLPANPNHTAKSRSQLSGDAPQKTVKDPSQLSRREREAIEAQQARERYMKLHAEGKTDEARSDLARLALVREKREADRLRKEAEKEEKAEVARLRAEERDAKLNGKKKGAPKKK